MQNIKKFTIMHYGLLALSLIYSFMFYNTIAVELAIMAIIFDIMKPMLFITAYNGNGITRTIFSVLVLILVTFNLLAISSSFINNYNKQSTSKVNNNNYNIHKDKLNQLKGNLYTIKTELNQYPTLEMFLSKSPKWEDKTALTSNWNQGKQSINTRLDTAQANYNKELSVNVDKYKTIDNKTGYNSVFTALSKTLKVDTKNLVLTLYLLFAIMLEILIFYTKTLSNKELKNYKKSNDELTKELMHEMQLELHRIQLEAIKNSFSNSIVGTINEVKTPIKEELKTFVIQDQEVEEIKQIEEVKEDHRIDEEVKNKYQYIRKTLDIDNIRKYHQYILDNLKDENIVIGIKKVASTLGLTQGEAMRIYNKLREKDYLETLEDKKTRLQKKKFNANDFLEV